MEQEKVSALVEENLRPIFAYALSRVSHREDAEDGRSFRTDWKRNFGRTGCTAEAIFVTGAPMSLERIIHTERSPLRGTAASVPVTLPLMRIMVFCLCRTDPEHKQIGCQ